MRRALLLVAALLASLPSRPEGRNLRLSRGPEGLDRRFQALAWDGSSRADQPSLKDLVRRAGAWVQRFADDSVFIVGDERYEQEYRTKDGSSWQVERRRLLSEIVFVRTLEEETRAGHPWVQFRDVVEVDGLPLPDHRGRLERLFKDAGASAYTQAQAMVAESARFNIGPGIRTVNVPSFALFFIHPSNQHRFRFEVLSYPPNPPHLPYQPNLPLQIAYRERARPTMILSVTHQDLPSSGVMWIDPSSGRVSKTRLDVQVARHWAMTTEVTYGHDAGIDAWVPQTMHEQFHDNDVLDCTATYTNYRRFRTSARLVPK